MAVVLPAKWISRSSDGETLFRPLAPVLWGVTGHCAINIYVKLLDVVMKGVGAKCQSKTGRGG